MHGSMCCAYSPARHSSIPPQLCPTQPIPPGTASEARRSGSYFPRSVSSIAWLISALLSFDRIVGAFGKAAITSSRAVRFVTVISDGCCAKYACTAVTISPSDGLAVARAASGTAGPANGLSDARTVVPAEDACAGAASGPVAPGWGGQACASAGPGAPEATFIVDGAALLSPAIMGCGATAYPGGIPYIEGRGAGMLYIDPGTDIPYIDGIGVCCMGGTCGPLKCEYVEMGAAGLTAPGRDGRDKVL